MTDTITRDALDLSPFTVDALARFALREASLTGNARIYATPYLQALTCCESLGDRYGMDRASDMARYALSNLSAWRGPIAKAWKAEMNARLKGLI